MTVANAVAKVGVKAIEKATRSKYLLFLREQLGKMTGKHQKSYFSIVSRKWKKIKEDPARLISYSNRAKKMKGVVGKPAKLGDGRSVSYMLMERTAVKNTQRQPKTAPKFSKFVNIDPEYSDNEKTELVVKKHQSLQRTQMIRKKNLQ